MKKISLLLAVFSFNFLVMAQDSPEAIKSKIDQLSKQKSDLEAQIADLNKKLPVPPTPTWTFKGNVGINFGQNLLGDWAAGGFSNFSLQGIGHLEANMKKGRHSWENGLDGNLGFVKNFDAVNGGDYPIQKSADMVQLNSKYLYDLQKGNLQLGLNLNFLSQFIKTWDNKTGTKLISDFLAPGFLDVSPGLQWKPTSYFKLFFSPASGRFTFVTNDTIINRGGAENRFGNDVGQTVRTELGAKLDAVFEKELVKNLSIRSRLQLFNNYTRPQSQIDAIYSSRANIDVVFQTDLFYKLTKNIALNFGFQTIKDDDVRFSNVSSPDADGKKSIWQVRQNFGAGMVFGF